MTDTTARRHLCGITLILSSVQDLPLQSSPLGVLVMSPAALTLGLLAGLDLWSSLKRRRIAIPVWIAIASVYVVTTSLYFAISYSGNASDGFLLRKTVSGLAILGMTAYCVAGSWYNASELRWYVIAALLVTVAGVLLGDIARISLFLDLGPFHATRINSVRARGFTAEPGHLGLIVIVQGLLALRALTGQLGRLAVLVLAVGVLAVSDSKGATLIALSAAPIFFIYRYGIRGLVLVPLLVFTAQVSGLWQAVFDRVVTQSLVNVQRFSSIATRGTMAVTTAMVIADHPFGTGATGLQLIADSYVPRAIGYVAARSPIPLNFEEVTGYVFASDRASIGAKSELGEIALAFGVAGIVGYLAFFGLSTRRVLKHEEYAGALVVAIIGISGATYTDFIGKVAPLLALGIARALPCAPATDDQSRIASLPALD